MITTGVVLIGTTLGIYGVCFLIVAVVQNSGNVGGAAPWSVWIFSVVFLGLSVHGWREVARVFRANIGIRLAPDHVGLNHKHQDLFLRWDQINNVTVAMVNKGSEWRKNVLPCVRIEADGGRIFHVDATELGSDPNVVAALMQCYLDHPQERDALTDPEEAIRRFSEAQFEQ
ncbi:hypothetical protein G7066_13970 [Leucobacter coleopterorum]|uniref:PH domain-containing protein n=1 Tax=Leucobacter coleopterorum TaxID=2714933 RepID=A0ABX6JYK5_9MICO|nr:hypothetical protein [Leucobacter coleopterorum]QIM19404.1 hypothetical protein G7066_13970 [Leucobacter coleopterorum]